MEMPKYSDLVRIIAQIGAVIGCIIGAITVLGGFAAFQYGFKAGFMAIAGGVYIIAASLAGLGIAYLFLALVQAQIDTRNAVVDYLNAQGRANR